MWKAWTAFPGAVVFSWENKFLFQSRKCAKSILGLIRDYFSLDNKGWIILEKEVSFLASYQLSLWSNLTFVSPYFVTSNWKFFKMTLSEGQLPFLSNLILSSKFCDFGFGLAMSEDKSPAGGPCASAAGNRALGSGQGGGRLSRERSDSWALKRTLSRSGQKSLWSRLETLNGLPDS